MIAMIAAVARNGAIGRGGKLPWRLARDMERFKSLTTGQVVVMGRKTFESLPSPLAARTSIALSRSSSFSPEGAAVARSLEEAFRLSRKIAPGKDIFIAGGAQVYKTAMELCDILFITEISADVEGDAFFPRIPLELFARSAGEEITGEELPYRFATYERRR